MSAFSTGLILAATALVPAEPDAPKKLVKDVYGVGVVGNCCTHGAGLCAMFQSRKDTRVVAAYEKTARRSGELKAALGRPLADSYDSVINNPLVDFVAIACDPSEKALMVEKAAGAGKAVFLNKPPCDSLDAARRIAAAVRLNKVWLVHDIPMVRSVPAFARLLEEVRARPYGKVLGYHHAFGMNFDPGFDLKSVWPERLDPSEKSGGGEMTNMGCYAIDYVVSLLGSPRSVAAKWRKEWDVYKAADVENFGQIILDYGDFFAMLEVGKQQLTDPSRHANSLTLNFEHRTLHIDASAQQVTVNHVPVPWVDYTRGMASSSSVDQLLAALRQGVEPSSGVGSILASTEVLMAAYESIEQGGRAITLPLQRGDNPLSRRSRSK